MTITWSHSRLNAYVICPRKFQYRYIDEAPSETTASALAFGSAIHEAFAHFYTDIKEGKDPNDNGIADVFRDAWQEQKEKAEVLDAPLIFRKTETFESLEEKGMAMLGVFCRGADRDVKVLSVEEQFAGISVGKHILGGFFDLVLSDGDGVKVIDHKTAASSYGPDKIRYDQQATAYLLAARSVYSCPATFEFQVLTKTKSPTLKSYRVTRNERDFAEFEELIDDVDKAVTAGVFPRHRGWACSGCEYARRCAS